MNAQEEWKAWYRSSKIAHYLKDQCRYEQRKVRREAALERIIARLQRENAALKKYRHDPRVPIVPRDPRWSDDGT